MRAQRLHRAGSPRERRRRARDGVGRLEERDLPLLRLTLVNGVGDGAFYRYERSFLASNYGAQPGTDESIGSSDRAKVYGSAAG